MLYSGAAARGFRVPGSGLVVGGVGFWHERSTIQG